VGKIKSTNLGSSSKDTKKQHVELLHGYSARPVLVEVPSDCSKGKKKDYNGGRTAKGNQKGGSEETSQYPALLKEN